MGEPVTTVEFENPTLAVRTMNALKMLGGMEVDLDRDAGVYTVYEVDS